MRHTVSCKRHRESEVVFRRDYEIGEGSFDFPDFFCTSAVQKRTQGECTEYQLHFRFRKTLGFPASVEFSTCVEHWKRENYVFVPGAVYNGNRFPCERMPYPPFHDVPREKALEAPSVISDFPHLSAEEPASRIQLRSGDMAVPAVGCYDWQRRRGVLIFAPHVCKGDYTGFSISEELSAETLVLSVCAPGVREKYRYFFGERADGSGFYPDGHTPSDDAGRYFEAGETMELTVRLYEFQADTLGDFFAYFNRIRGCLEQGGTSDVVPFSAAYQAVKEKYQRENYIEEGYYGVGTEQEHPLSCWQAGWVGGGMNNYPFLLEDEGEAFERGLSTFRFILDRLQLPSGWICGVYAKGVFYGDRFDYNQPGSVLLMRKDADLLLFLMKQAMLLREQGILQECYEEKLRRFCDAFVALFERYGQLGQFIDAETGEMLIGNTASGAIASAGLALAYEFFGDGRFLETARKLGVYYYDHYVSRGMLNGGPGDACQAPDSESAFGMLESYVQLYETTGEERWLACAEETFQQAVTWVMSYDFAFPAESFSAKRRIHTLGTIFANAQNKHATPGICTLSGNSILKLYRFTGNSEYLCWMKAISHAIPQFVSLRERPVLTLEKKYLPSGWINERVQTCDWEGKETVGEFLYGSNWPEVTMLLTYTEVPGIYADFSSGTAEAFDHIRCKVLERKEDEMLLELCNETMYDAVVTVLADDRLKRGLVKHNYFGRMKKVRLPAQGRETVRLHRPL